MRLCSLALRDLDASCEFYDSFFFLSISINEWENGGETVTRRDSFLLSRMHDAVGKENYNFISFDPCNH